MQNVSQYKSKNNTPRKKKLSWLGFKYNKPLTRHVKKSKIIRVNERYLQTIPDGDVAVLSPTGTGKTTCVGKITKPAATANCLAHRKTLITAMAKGLGLKDYQDENLSHWQYIDQDKLAVCINSIIHMRQPDKAVPTYDVLVLEELDQMIKHMVGGTMESKDEKLEGDELNMAISILIELIRKAKRVIVNSATLDPFSWDFLTKTCRRDMTLLVNEYVPDRGTLHMHDQYSSIHSHLMSTIAEHTPDMPPIYVFSDTKSKLRAIETEAQSQNPQLRILLISADTNDLRHVKAFMKNPSTEYLKYDLVLASPAVVSGVSIDPETSTGEKIITPHIYGIFTNTFLDATDIVQMTDRVRHRLNTHIHITHKANAEKPRSHKAIHKDHVKAWIETGKLVNFMEDGITPQLDPVRDSVLKICSQVNARMTESIHRLQKHFLLLVSGQYSKQIEHTDGVEGAVDEHVKIKKEHKEEYEKLLVTTPRIDKDAYDIARASGHYDPLPLEAGRQRDIYSHWLGRDFSSPELEAMITNRIYAKDLTDVFYGSAMGKRLS